MGFNHTNIPADGQHVIHRWEITSVNELDTIAISVSELHKLALDTTMNVYYKLSNITPRSWTKINSSTTFNDDYIPSIEKGAVNGIAPLDSTGKLSIDYLPDVVNKVESVNSQVGVVNLTSSDVGAIASTEKGSASGVVPLDTNAKIIDTYLPNYVSTVNNKTGVVELLPSDIGAISLAMMGFTAGALGFLTFAATMKTIASNADAMNKVGYAFEQINVAMKGSKDDYVAVADAVERISKVNLKGGGMLTELATLLKSPNWASQTINPLDSAVA